MTEKVWATNQDGSIEYRQLSSNYLEEAIALMGNAFFCHETVCRAVGLPNDAAAITELEELTRRATEDGVTVIAIDKNLNKVVGAAFNKLQVRNDSAFFENFGKICKHSRSRAILNFMTDIDNSCNLFDLCQVDCLLEIMFLGTSPEYRGKGIAKKLCEVTIEVGRTLLDGANVKQSVDGKELSLEPVPKVVTAIFTSFITQKIGRQLGFQIAAEKDYELFEFEGKSYTSVIGRETPSLTLEYKRLK